jgi:hypothetical protein
VVVAEVAKGLPDFSHSQSLPELEKEGFRQTLNVLVWTFILQSK